MSACSTLSETAYTFSGPCGRCSHVLWLLRLCCVTLCSLPCSLQAAGACDEQQHEEPQHEEPQDMDAVAAVAVAEAAQPATVKVVQRVHHVQHKVIRVKVPLFQLCANPLPPSPSPPSLLPFCLAYCTVPCSTGLAGRHCCAVCADKATMSGCGQHIIVLAE